VSSRRSALPWALSALSVRMSRMARCTRGAHGASRRSTRSRRQARVRACGGTLRRTARTGCLPGRGLPPRGAAGRFPPVFGEVDVLAGESGQDLDDPYCGGLAELALQPLLDAEHRLKLLAGEEAADEHLRVRGPDPVDPYPGDLTRSKWTTSLRTCLSHHANGPGLPRFCRLCFERCHENPLWRLAALMVADGSLT
jgi:hypothetical protein